MDTLNEALKPYGYYLRREAGKPIELLGEQDQVLATFATLTEAGDFVDALEAAGDWRYVIRPELTPPVRDAYPKGRWTL